MKSHKRNSLLRGSIQSTHSLPQVLFSSLRGRKQLNKAMSRATDDNDDNNDDISVDRALEDIKQVEIQQRERRYTIYGHNAKKKSFQMRLYNFLDRPTGLKCFVYHFSVFLMVLFCLILSVLSTVNFYNHIATHLLYYSEIILVFVFGIEYCARIWSCGCRSIFMGWRGRLRFALKPISIIDLLVVLSSGIVLCLGAGNQMFATTAVRGIRFIQILRILHVDRQGGTWKLLGSVIYNHRQELITSMYIGFLGLIFLSYFVFMAENIDKPSLDFVTYADALWWGFITVTTIGYGDKVPHTWTGRIIASCFSVITISFFALPAGILGSGFALKVQQKQKEKHFNRQIPAAATLIQCLWRYYATFPEVKSVATWNWYKINKNEGESQNNLYRRMSRSFQKSPFQSKINLEPEMTVKFEDSVGFTETQKLEIRIIRKMRYYVAKKKFQHARQPYDVRDVMEQYSQGQSSIIMRLKEFQRRIEQSLLKKYQCSSSKHNECFIARLRNVDTKINRLENKLDLNHDLINETIGRLTHLEVGMNKILEILEKPDQPEHNATDLDC